MLPRGRSSRASPPLLCARLPLALLTSARVPAQFPFALPQIPTFRDLTGTQGVDQYKLSYHDYCHGDGSATQVTADSLDALGIDVRKDDPFMPNAAILRSAEAVDSILNAASSGSPDVPNAMNAGRILCSSDADAPLTHSHPLEHPLPTQAPLFVPCMRPQFASWAG